MSIARIMMAGACALALAAPAARAEVSEVTLARQFGISFMPLMLMEHAKLVEKHAERQGVTGLKVTWASFSGPSPMNEAMISGQLHFASVGVPSLGLLWEKTKGNIGVKGVAAMCSYPLYLNTRNPAVQSLKDFGEKDRIAVPSVKVSTQAIMLQMLAEQVFGPGQHVKIDHLTVSLSHPDGMAAILNPGSEITAHFTTSPFHEREMKMAGMRTLLTSYDILGGQATAVVMTATERFRAANPKVYAAVKGALDEAIATVNADKAAAARLYVELSRERSATPADIQAMMTAPGFDYTLAPQKVFKTVAFMHKIGSVKALPATWQEMFFPEVHGLQGD